MSSPSPDSPHIRRPLNSFFLYRLDKNNEMKAMKTHSGPQWQRSQTIAEEWHQEPPEVKIAYKKLADAARERHAQQHPNYRFKAGKKKKKVKTDAHPAYRKIGRQSAQRGVPPLDDYPSVLFPQNGGSPPLHAWSSAGPSASTDPGPSTFSPDLGTHQGASYGTQPELEHGIPNHISMEEYRNMLVAHQLHQQYTAARAYAEQAWHILHQHLLRTTTQFHSRPPNNHAQAAQHAMLTQMQQMPLPAAFPMDGYPGQNHINVTPVVAPAYMPWQMGPPGPPQDTQSWQEDTAPTPRIAGIFRSAHANQRIRAAPSLSVQSRGAPAVQPQHPPHPLDVRPFDLTQNSEGPSRMHAPLSPPPATPQDLQTSMPNLWDTDFEGPVISEETDMLSLGLIFPSPSATMDSGHPPQDSLLLGEGSSGGSMFVDVPFQFDAGSSSSVYGSQYTSGQENLDSQDQMQPLSAADASFGSLEDAGSSLETHPVDSVAAWAEYFNSADADAWLNFPDE